jgi:uncharacterized membrane protein YccF (DUF307 family)
MTSEAPGRPAEEGGDDLLWSPLGQTFGEVAQPLRPSRSLPVRLVLNILWFVLGGWLSGTLWLLAGELLAITFIGLPLTPAAFRIAGFSYLPFGKVVVEAPPEVSSTLLNVLWLILAGWWLALHHLALALALAVTIVGIPFAWQHVKLAMLSLTPVGKLVVEA